MGYCPSYIYSRLFPISSQAALLRFLAYVLPVKVEMEMVIQQYEKAKVIQDEQLERLTQICQEQGVRSSFVRVCVCKSVSEQFNSDVNGMWVFIEKVTSVCV